MSGTRKYKVPPERQKLKDKLPKGSGVKIAKMAGVSENSVCNYWNGEGNNARITKAISELLDNEIVSEQKLNEQVATLDKLQSGK